MKKYLTYILDECSKIKLNFTFDRILLDSLHKHCVLK